jgi:hypothetical protein
MLKGKEVIHFIKERMWLKYSLMIVLFTFLFLFAQKPVTPTRTYCGEYIKVSKIGFVLFCDSYQYIYLTSKPSLLLDSNFVAVRQNRPLYIYTAHLIGLPIKYVVDAIISTDVFKRLGGEKYLYQQSINEKLASSPFLKMYNIDNHKNLVVELLPFYCAFILMNFIILLGSLVLFERLLSAIGIRQFVMHFLSLFIVCSGIVKAFFFSAHEQMFAFFTPISIAYIVFLFLNDKLTQKKLIYISFIMGILCLAYGSFILYFPCLGIAYLVKQKYIRIHFRLIADLFPQAILFILPTFSWIVVCIYFSGHYFNGEVAVFREFVWVIDALSIGISHFFEMSLDFLFRYLNTVLITLTPFLTGIYLINKKIRQSAAPVTSHQLYYQFIRWMFLLFFVFFFVLGYYNFRLTYTCVPMLLILIAMKIQQLLDNNYFDEAKLYKRLKIISVIWIIWSVFKYGPFPFQ